MMDHEPSDRSPARAPSRLFSITELSLEMKLLECGADLSLCRGRQTPEDVRDFWRKLHARLT